MAAKKDLSLASSTSAETEKIEGEAGMTVSAGGGRKDAFATSFGATFARVFEDTVGDVPEARTALTSASEGDSLPPIWACGREGR